MKKWYSFSIRAISGRQYTADLLHDGLEIPCVITIEGNGRDILYKQLKAYRGSSIMIKYHYVLVLKGEQMTMDTKKERRK